jgi:uncharacterized phosphosugar-binding protein
MADGPFVTRLIPLLAKLEEQDEAFGQASRLMADTIVRGGLVHLFGSGHSVIPVMDSFPRYGSFVGLNPLTDPRLMWHNVLGPGGVRELLWLERTEGYVANFLANCPINEGDVLIAFSHGGRNAAPVEAARFARQAGASVIAVTSKLNLSTPASHSSGKRLVDFADITIDTGVPVEDALVTVDGWDAPVAGGSTIVACVCVGELVARTAQHVAAQGVSLPTFISPTVPGWSVEANDTVFHAYRARLRQASDDADA